MIPLLAKFDTRIDTTNKIVPITISLKLRNYINKEGKSPIYLHVSSHGDRQRVNLDLWVKPKYWNKKKECLVGPAVDVEIDNLLIDNVKAKVTKIKTTYKLSELELTKDEFIYEFLNNMSRVNYVTFFKSKLEERKSQISKATYAKELAVWNKLNGYSNEIIFKNIDLDFFDKYRSYLAKLGNNKQTRNGNIKILKKYLRFAVKAGVGLRIDLDDIVSGPTKGQKTYLNSDEVQKLHDYFYSSHIPYNQKICLGYFLFSCFTGLRSSDTLAQTRDKIKKGYFEFIHIKTGKKQIVKVNKRAADIVNHCDDLFVKKYSPSHIRNLVKDICSFFQITKRVDYHTSRHTFGTNYILLGGKVTTLQILLNHSDIRETMVYVHMAELERNAEADIMDKLVS